MKERVRWIAPLRNGSLSARSFKFGRMNLPLHDIVWLCAGGQEAGEVAGDDICCITVGEQATAGFLEGAGDELAAGEPARRRIVQGQVGEDVLEDDDQDIPAVIPTADLPLRPGQGRRATPVRVGEDGAEVRSLRPAQVP